MTHLKGRNASHVSKMIHAIRQYNNNSSQESSKITISVEIEKTKPEIQSLLPEGDVVSEIKGDRTRAKGETPRYLLAKIFRVITAVKQQAKRSDILQAKRDHSNTSSLKKCQ